MEKTLKPPNAPKHATAGGSVDDLPLHLTEKILCCINPLESAHLFTVCKSWAAIVSERLARPVPHIFVFNTPQEKPGYRGVIVSVVPSSLEGARLPSSAAVVIPSRVRWADTTCLSCIGATRNGRLAFAWNSRVLLVNPVTGASHSINLAGLRPGKEPLLVTSGRRDSLFFCSVDDDNDELLLWRWAGGGGSNDVRTYRASLVMDMDVPCTWEKIVSVTECRGRFYLMYKDRCFVSMSMIDATMPPPHRVVSLPAVPGRTAFYGESYPLESNGELLFVLSSRADKEVQCSSCGHSTVRSVIDGFELYMLGAKDKHWRKVEKLAGDRALFVNPESSFSSFALHAPHTLGCMSNCVYFIRKNRYCSICKSVLSENTWGVYSLEDEKILCEHAFTTKTAKWTKEFWFLPRV